MEELLKKINKCRICEKKLQLGANPVLYANKKARIVIIGQAPGLKVHKTGIPWNDESGKRLRKWLDLPGEKFYNNEKIAIVPMAFCYPGKAENGDLPPSKECAPLWHKELFKKMPDLKLFILIGQYAIKYYLKGKTKRNLTLTVENYLEYLPDFLVLPHPSPLNRGWIKKNPWYEQKVLPVYRRTIKKHI